MTSTTFHSPAARTALDRQRNRLINQTIVVSHSSRELALTADMFSERIRSQQNHTSAELQNIENHLAQLRRNCADAQYMAETVRSQLEGGVFNWQTAQACEDTLRDAQVRLTLADFAYDRASDLTVHRKSS